MLKDKMKWIGNENMDGKKVVRKVLPYCGLYVILFVAMAVGAVMLQYWEMGFKQCMDPSFQKWDVGNLTDYAYQIVADEDGYVTNGTDPFFVLEVEHGPMVDIVLSGLPQEGSSGELYFASDEEDFTPAVMQYYTFHNGHNIVRLPEDHSDWIRVDVFSSEGIHFQVKSIMSGSPGALFLMAYWKQLALLALLIVVLWWFI